MVTVCAEPQRLAADARSRPVVEMWLTTGSLELHEDGGQRVAGIAHGHAYFRRAGVGHDVVNAGEIEVAFVEVEFKIAPGGDAPSS
jgi:hypothetical protein